jgi:hypothetical protein
VLSQVSSKPRRKQPGPIPKGYEILTSPQWEGQCARAALVGIPRSPFPVPAAWTLAGGARAMVAKHMNTAHVRTSSTPVEHIVVYRRYVRLVYGDGGL